MGLVVYWDCMGERCSAIYRRRGKYLGLQRIGLSGDVVLAGRGCLLFRRSKSSFFWAGEAKERWPKKKAVRSEHSWESRSEDVTKTNSYKVNMSQKRKNKCKDIM